MSNAVTQGDEGFAGGASGASRRAHAEAGVRRGRPNWRSKSEGDEHVACSQHGAFGVTSAVTRATKREAGQARLAAFVPRAGLAYARYRHRGFDEAVIAALLHKHSALIA